MKKTQGNGYLVIDDFLNEDELFAIQLYMQFEKYFPVHSNGWSKSWRLTDGAPFTSPCYIFSCLTRNTTLNAEIISDGMNVLSRKLLEIYGELREFLGDDWNAFSLTSYLYPSGTGLGWHEDDALYKGAYIFYAHPEWRPSWGGELCIIDTAVSSSAGLSEKVYDASENVLRLSGIIGGAVGPEFGWTIRDRNINESGIGTFVYPKPNRLVVIKPNYSHCIKKVDTSAGENVRCSVAGFFHQNA
ncbi:2OG-Fe(II) oxygenase [Aeromonas sp. MdU4]|uniref:2OG-Fe(II) oxygenase n=1 Tax=Aeromonas sp. MdU4 TaxID=3342819 RepID=UPI0035B78FAF